MLNNPLSVSPLPATKLYVHELPSASVLLNVPTAAFDPAFSATDVLDKAISVGASSASVIFIVNVSS